jgi:type VI secretion system protein ImpL
VLVFTLYWATVLVRVYGPRLSIDGNSLLDETWQQLTMLVPLYLGGLVWFCLSWRHTAVLAKRRVLEAQADLETLSPTSASELRLREQIKQWRLQAQAEGGRPTYLLFNWPVVVQKRRVVPELTSAADTPPDSNLRIDRVGRYNVLTVSDCLLSQFEPDESRLWHCLLDEIKNAQGGPSGLVGGVLVLNAEKLQSGGADQDLQALSLRERLEELARAIGKGLPVQAIVTHCASLPGYTASIAGLPVDERDLAVDFPLAANQVNLQRLAEHMSKRLARLDDSLLERLQMEPLTLFRTQLYGFAPMWRQFSGQVQVFLQTVFHAQARLQSLRFSGAALAEDQAGISSSALLLRTLQHCERHGLWRTPIKYLAVWLRSYQRYWLIVIVVCVSLLLINNYRHHTRVLDYLAQQQNVLKNLSPASSQGNLARFNTLAKMVNVPEDNWLQPSLGLYQYQRLVRQVQDLYEQSLQEAFTPVVIAGMTTLLSDPKADIYDSFRLYLMLGRHISLDLDFVEDRLWTSLEPRMRQQLSGAQLESLGANLQRLLHQVTAAPVLQVNEALVEMAHEQIARESLSRRVYRQLLASLQSPTHKDISVASVTGAEGLLLIESRGGQSVDVPWLFTKEGYKEFNKRLSPFVTKALRVDTGMGLNRQQDFGHVRDEILSLYLSDYIQSWEHFIADLKFAGLNTSEQLPRRLERLSQDGAILSKLLQVINRETRLGGGTDNEGMINRVLERLSTLTLRLGISAAKMSERAPEQNPVTQHFASFHQLTEGVNGRPSPLEQIREALAYTGTYLLAREAATTSQLSTPDVNALDNLHRLTGTLPQLLRPLFNDIVNAGGGWVRESWSTSLSNEWAKSLGPYCQRVVRHSYPFDRQASDDVPLQDFNQLLAPDGLLQSFSRDRLGAVNALLSSADTQFAGAGIDPVALMQFHRAERISKVFFPAGSSQARIDFELSPVTLDEEIASFSLTLDDRQLNYSHGPILPSLFTWPSQALGSRLKAVVTLFDGRTLQLSEHGAWGWFRLLDRGTLSNGPTSDSQWLTLTFEGYKVVIQIRNVSIESPFGDQTLNEFSCPSI